MRGMNKSDNMDSFMWLFILQIFSTSFDLRSSSGEKSFSVENFSFFDRVNMPQK